MIRIKIASRSSTIKEVFKENKFLYEQQHSNAALEIEPLLLPQSRPKETSIVLSNPTIRHNIEILKKIYYDYKNATEIVGHIKILRISKIIKKLGEGGYGKVFLLANGLVLKLHTDDQETYEPIASDLYRGKGDPRTINVVAKGEIPTVEIPRSKYMPVSKTLKYVLMSRIKPIHIYLQEQGVSFGIIIKISKLIERTLQDSIKDSKTANINYVSPVKNISGEAIYRYMLKKFVNMPKTLEVLQKFRKLFIDIFNALKWYRNKFETDWYDVKLDNIGVIELENGEYRIVPFDMH